MKLFTSVAASVAAVVVSSVTGSSPPDGNVPQISVAEMSSALSMLMFNIGDTFCPATAAGDITALNDTMPACIGEFAPAIGAIVQTLSVCMPDGSAGNRTMSPTMSGMGTESPTKSSTDSPSLAPTFSPTYSPTSTPTQSPESPSRRRLDTDMSADDAFSQYVGVLTKGLQLSLASGDLDIQIKTVLRNDAMPVLLNDVLKGCVLDTTGMDSTVLAILSLVFKGESMTDGEYGTLKGFVQTLLSEEEGPVTDRRLDSEPEGNESPFTGACMTGGPDGGLKLAYGPPLAFVQFLLQTMNEVNPPSSCAICEMLAAVPMSTENAIDAVLISFLTGNRANVTKLVRDVVDLIHMLFAHVAADTTQGSMAAAVCNVDKTPNLAVLGFGLGNECIGAATMSEDIQWRVFADVVVGGLPATCDAFSDYLCGEAEPVLPFYSVETLSETEHALLADMVRKLPEETVTLSSYLLGLKQVCDPDTFPSPTVRPSPAPGSTNAPVGATKAPTAAAASTTLSVFAVLSALTVVAFVK